MEGLHLSEIYSDIRRAALGRTFLLPLGGLHVKYAVKRGIFGTNSAFVLGSRKTTKFKFKLIYD
jgi:hypothetical protein